MYGSSGGYSGGFSMRGNNSTASSYNAQMGGNYSSTSSYSSPIYQSNNDPGMYSIDKIVQDSCVQEKTRAGTINSIYTSNFKPPTIYQDGTYLTNIPHNNFLPADFLNPFRPQTPIIENAGEIFEFIRTAFKATTGMEFPNNISIQVLQDEEFKQAHLIHGGHEGSEGLMGFSLNTQGRGVDEIFVKVDHFDRLMLTIGHEIGHVMSKSLPNQHDEEAKAFAFSMAWMEALVTQQIAGLHRCISPEPAHNGLHDVAFLFVRKLLNAGKKSIEIFNELAQGAISIIEQPILIMER